MNRARRSNSLPKLSEERQNLELMLMTCLILDLLGREHRVSDSTLAKPHTLPLSRLVVWELTTPCDYARANAEHVVGRGSGTQIMYMTISEIQDFNKAGS